MEKSTAALLIRLRRPLLPPIGLAEPAVGILHYVKRHSFEAFDRHTTGATMWSGLEATDDQNTGVLNR